MSIIGFASLLSQTLELPQFSNLLIGPATAGLELYFPILDILDTAVQNHPVIAGPCLALRHKDTKEILLTTEDTEDTEEKTESANERGHWRVHSLTPFFLSVLCG